MILLTVGTQLGFDRLIAAMDAIAPSLDQPVIAQTGIGSYTPQHMRAQPTFDPAQFDGLAAQADLIISHAGIGSVLTARRHNKPIVLMPRHADLGEHRNDHQLATAAQLRGRAKIFVAENTRDLASTIHTALGHAERVEHCAPANLEHLRSAVSDFILGL